MNPYKIFGIGLSRTGTASLHNALTILGFNSVHFPRIFMVGGNDLVFYPNEAHYYDAMVDTPVAVFYKKLDDIFCDSKFILTERDIPSWLRSCEKFFSLPSFEGNKIARLIAKKLYGLDGDILFDWNKYLLGYHNHINDIKEYFKDRKQDLLTIDICGGEGWEKLCPFLEVGIPDVPFPHDNKLEQCIEIDKKITE